MGSFAGVGYSQGKGHGVIRYAVAADGGVNISGVWITKVDDRCHCMVVYDWASQENCRSQVLE